MPRTTDAISLAVADIAGHWIRTNNEIQCGDEAEATVNAAQGFRRTCNQLAAMADTLADTIGRQYHTLTPTPTGGATMQELPEATPAPTVGSERLRTVLTDQEAANKLANDCRSGDTESDHSKADDILCDLLASLGYTLTVEAYGEIGKWYA